MESDIQEGGETLNIDRTQAYRFIKVYEEIKDVGTYQHLGLRALSEIATLPEPERTKEHTTSKGETKTGYHCLLMLTDDDIFNS